MSLLSLLAADRFAILAGPGGDGWREAAADAGLKALRGGQDFEDETEGWTELTGLPKDGALLVRPDGHIACRFEGGANDAAALLGQALAQVLAR